MGAVDCGPGLGVGLVIESYEFDSRPLHRQVVTQLFPHICLCHQAV